MAGLGGDHHAPGSWRASTSSTAAVSATERVTTPSVPNPSASTRGVRDPSSGRLEPDEPGARRGHADGPAAVGCMRDRRHPGCHRDPCAARRAAGSAVGVPRVAGDAEGLVLCERHGAELRGRGLAHQNEADVDEPFHHRVGLRGGRPAGRCGAVCGRPPGHVDDVFDRQGHAVERRQVVGRRRVHERVSRG